MRVTDVKTFIVDCFRTNWVFVKVYTDEGIDGVGEGTLEYKEKALGWGARGRSPKLCRGTGACTRPPAKRMPPHLYIPSARESANTPTFCGERL